MSYVQNIFNTKQEQLKSQASGTRRCRVINDSRCSYLLTYSMVQSPS